MTVETRHVDQGLITKTLHVVLQSSYPAGDEEMLEIIYLGKGMSRHDPCLEECVDMNLHHRLLEEGQKIVSPASPRRKVPGEVGVPANMQKLLP